LSSDRREKCRWTTFGGLSLKLEYKLLNSRHKSNRQKTYRNPIIYAQELSEEMRREGLTQAELARKHGLSRARVNQWLSLLKLPKNEIRRILATGDHWNRRLVAERGLRRLLKS
jgi:ParB-like chromosome segregation protein Spo0J